MAAYTVGSISDTVYLNARNQAVRGHNVDVYYPDFNEWHTFQLPDILPSTIKTAAEEYYNNRKAVAQLGVSAGSTK